MTRKPWAFCSSWKETKTELSEDTLSISADLAFDVDCTVRSRSLSTVDAKAERNRTLVFLRMALSARAKADVGELATCSWALLMVLCVSGGSVRFFGADAEAAGAARSFCIARPY